MDGITPGLELGLATDAISGNAPDPDRGRHRHAYPLHFAAAGSCGAFEWHDDADRWRHGPTDGSNATTVTPGPGNIATMLRAFEGWPVNVGILGQGSWPRQGALVEQIEAGAVGFKCHEDWGTTPAVLRSALTVADEMDVQVCIHTDTLNESGFVEDSIAAFEGRTVHSFHTEGAGGGHAPTCSRSSASPTCCPASTNPTLPCGVNSQAELYDMIMVCHHLAPRSPPMWRSPRAASVPRRSPPRTSCTISARSPCSRSDSQAMGRIGESWLRGIQTADAMKTGRGKLPEDAPGNDNFRVLRYVAKITINPAITARHRRRAGLGRVGKMADLVLWEPAFFGAKPKMVIKGGMIIWALMGDPNASLPTPQPMYYRPMFGRLWLGSAGHLHHLRLRSRLCCRNRRAAGPQTRRCSRSTDIRKIGKKDMVRKIPGSRRSKCQPGNLRGHRRRRPRTVRPEDDLAQPEVFLQLMSESLRR